MPRGFDPVRYAPAAPSAEEQAREAAGYYGLAQQRGIQTDMTPEQLAGAKDWYAGQLLQQLGITPERAKQLGLNAKFNYANPDSSSDNYYGWKASDEGPALTRMKTVGQGGVERQVVDEEQLVAFNADPQTWLKNRMAGLQGFTIGHGDNQQYQYDPVTGKVKKVWTNETAAGELSMARAAALAAAMYGGASLAGATGTGSGAVAANPMAIDPALAAQTGGTAGGLLPAAAPEAVGGLTAVAANPMAIDPATAAQTGGVAGGTIPAAAPEVAVVGGGAAANPMAADPATAAQTGGTAGATVPAAPAGTPVPPPVTGAPVTPYVPTLKDVATVLTGAGVIDSVLNGNQSSGGGGGYYQRTPEQEERFTRKAPKWDWDKINADAAAAGMSPNQYIARNWNKMQVGSQYEQPVVKKATGGLMPDTLGAYVGGLNQIQGLARGGGTGRSDDINARLSDGEYVMDAETVAMLGDGSTQAGAKRLDAMRQQLRRHKGAALAKGEFSPSAKSPLSYLKGEA